MLDFENFLEIQYFKSDELVIYVILIKSIFKKMSRKFLRSILAHDPFFNDPFFQPYRIPFRVSHYRPLEVREEKPIDPAHEIFNEFFMENGIKNEEKAFFEKNYPEKMQKKFDPYEILGVGKDTTIDQVKDAYRQEALKCHPKNDSSPQAEQRFKDLAKAYDLISGQKYYGNEEQVTSSSFFDDFHSQVNEIFNQGKTQSIKEKGGERDQNLKGAQLYSQSTYVENVNGKKKVTISKEYKKDGKILKLEREEKFRPDGTKQVVEKFDDGKQVKKKSFVENVEQKKLGN